MRESSVDQAGRSVDGIPTRSSAIPLQAVSHQDMRVRSLGAIDASVDAIAIGFDRPAEGHPRLVGTRLRADLHGPRRSGCPGTRERQNGARTPVTVARQTGLILGGRGSDFPAHEHMFGMSLGWIYLIWTPERTRSPSRGRPGSRRRRAPRRASRDHALAQQRGPFLGGVLHGDIDGITTITGAERGGREPQPALRPDPWDRKPGHLIGASLSVRNAARRGRAPPRGVEKRSPGQVL